MKVSRLFVSLACVAVSLTGLQATTVIPPTFDELVGRAELIFQGTVTDVRSEWTGEGKQRHIQSYVTLRVDDQIKGKPGASYTLSMLGGTVGEQTMEVTDTPKFKVGDRDILFVENNGTQFIPLVGIMHGRFRVQREEASGREIVATESGRFLSDVSQLGKDERAATAGKALSTGEFKAAINEKIRTGSTTAREQ